MTTGLYDRLSRVSAFAPVRRHDSLTRTDGHDPSEVLASLGMEVGRNHYGEYAVARQWYSTPEIVEPCAEVLPLLLPRKSELSIAAMQQALDPHKWLFLDTETTGLAGGTGTYAFLIGLAWWESGGIHVEQLFMRDHDEEHSILLELANRLRERPILVTFNGKCFDWPLLQNRFRMTRQLEIPLLAAHLDFLHPARQLWRLQIGSVRLSDLERQILGPEALGWSRDGDIDSSRIPEFYNDFLRGGVLDGIAGVVQHNRMDLRGLAALSGRIFRALANPDNFGSDDVEPLELYSISRILSRRGESSKARRVCERSLDVGLPNPIARRAMHEAARMAKRDRDFGRAIELWDQLATSQEPSFDALVQLAIYYERQARDYSEAARVAYIALSELRRIHRLGLVKSERFDHVSAGLKKRLIRLEAKCNQAVAMKS